MPKLTAVKVRSETKPGLHGDGGGLALQVKTDPKGKWIARSWVFRYKLNGKARYLGLGSTSDVSLADAREKAAEARKLIRAGLDPIDERRRAEAEARSAAGLTTFAEVAAAYIAAHEPSWKNPKHRQQWRNTLETYATPVLGEISVAAIGVGEVTRVLEPIWRDKPETASRLRGRIEQVLDYATARGWRKGDNPARWKGHLDNLLPARGKLARVEHHAALPWREVGAFMAELNGQPGIAAKALAFTILTASRTSETVGATWREIDLANKVWTIDGRRMKAGREHRVPLSNAALAILKDMQIGGTKPDAPVFPGGRAGRPLSTAAMSALLARMGRDVTVHGFRSTFRDWCGEATNYPREVAEAALAHTLRDATEAAYRRGDALEKRRKLMADWAVYCARPTAVGEVVALRA